MKSKLKFVLRFIFGATRYLLNILNSLSSYKLLSLGFVSYAMIGLLFISLPFSQKTEVSFIDNLFNVVSAMSTTGLTTAAISDIYTNFGLIVLLALMQLGGIGYMTLSSFVILSRFNSLSHSRVKILSLEFPLPDGMDINSFIRHIIFYTLAVEGIGAVILWKQFYELGVDAPLWSAVFHSISAFATAGFSIYPDSLSAFKDDYGVNLTIGALCYAGAIGFIVPMDIFRRLCGKTKNITLTSKIILVMTSSILFIGTVFCYAASNQTVLESFFQIMSASTTAGFNSVPIGALPLSVLMIIMLAMVIGASPSGTGGGIKTTSISVLVGIILSVVRGEREKVKFWGNAIPFGRVFTAVATSVAYIVFLFFIVLLLGLTEKFSFLQLSFEAASALGTVGLSMGISGDLSDTGKLIITLAMFCGRVGLLALAMSVFRPKLSDSSKSDDLAV